MSKDLKSIMVRLKLIKTSGMFKKRVSLRPICDWRLFYTLYMPWLEKPVLFV